MPKVTAPNGDRGRDMFLWSAALVDTAQKRKDVAAFCVDRGVTRVLVAVYPWIGGSNWSQANEDALANLVFRLKVRGVAVYALGGNLGWANVVSWVETNFLTPINNFNAAHPNLRFSGLIIDDEYWVDETSYPPATYVPSLCDLVDHCKSFLGMPVGCFVARFLMDGSRADITYDGLTGVDGKHFVKWCDEIWVGSYSNIAETEGEQLGQIEMMESWIDYADSDYPGRAVWSCSETLEPSGGIPAWITYDGKTLVYMEGEHTKISGYFVGTTFWGQAIHCYSSYRLMV